MITVKKIVGLMFIALAIMPILPMQPAQAYVLGSCVWNPMETTNLTFKNANLSTTIWEDAIHSINVYKLIAPQINLVEVKDDSSAKIIFVAHELPKDVPAVSVSWYDKGRCTKVVIQIDEDKLTNDNKKQIMQILGHEFGHALGLDHSDNKRSIMTFGNNPYADYGTFVVGKDEFYALQELYGFNNIAWGTNSA